MEVSGRRPPKSIPDALDKLKSSLDSIPDLDTSPISISPLYDLRDNLTRCERDNRGLNRSNHLFQQAMMSLQPQLNRQIQLVNEKKEQLGICIDETQRLQQDILTERARECPRCRTCPRPPPQRACPTYTTARPCRCPPPRQCPSTTSAPRLTCPPAVTCPTVQPATCHAPPLCECPSLPSCPSPPTLPPPLPCPAPPPCDPCEALNKPDVNIDITGLEEVPIAEALRADMVAQPRVHYAFNRQGPPTTPAPSVESLEDLIPRRLEQKKSKAKAGFLEHQDIHSKATLITTAKDFESNHLDQENWHTALPNEYQMFRQEGTIIGDVQYVHIIYDIHMEDLIYQSHNVCSKVLEEELATLASTPHKNFYKVLLKSFQKRCKSINLQLHDSYDTFISGSHNYMFHKYSRPNGATFEDHGLEREKRQFLIIGGALLIMGIIAAVGYGLSKMKLAEISVGSFNNKATIHTLEHHEQRLNLDEQDINILKNTTEKIIQGSNAVAGDVAKLQMLHQIEDILDQYDDQVFRLTLGLEQLRQGRLSALLVKPRVMQRLLREFKERLQTINMKTLITDTNDFYTCDTSHLVFKNGTIRAIVHVPAYKESSLLQFYRFLPLPLDVGLDHFVQLFPLATHVAVNRERTLFKTFDEAELLTCKELHEVKYCHNNNGFHRKPNSCLEFIFSQKDGNILTHCPIQVTQVQNAMVQVSPREVILYHAQLDLVTLTCAHTTPKQVSLSFEGYHLFQLYPGCSLQTSEFIINGVSDLYVEPKIINIKLPEYREYQDFKTLVNHIKFSGDELSKITSQKRLRIDDINQLFKDEANIYTWSIGVFSVLIALFLVCTGCCIYCYCCRGMSCPQIRRATPPSVQPTIQQQPRVQGESIEMSDRSDRTTQPSRPLRTPPLPRPLNNPARKFNKLY